MSSQCTWFSLPILVGAVNLYFTYATFTDKVFLDDLPLLRLVGHNLVATKLLVSAYNVNESNNLVEGAAWLTYFVTAAMSLCFLLGSIMYDPRWDDLPEMQTPVTIIGPLTAFAYGSIFLWHIG
ncbi:hypothetical protein JCM10207_005608 [Rhodosporidiobolus poonsookiae]